MGGRRVDDMLVEVDLSAIVADMEDGAEEVVGRHGAQGVVADFMNMVSAVLFSSWRPGIFC